MITFPELIDEFKIRILTNAVLVGHIKYTNDKTASMITSHYTADNPAPQRLVKQFSEFTNAYQQLDEVFARQKFSLITTDISALDREGDQLIYAIKGIVEAALRMDFDADRQAAAKTYDEFFRRYDIDPTENMFAEWSRVQQLVSDGSGSARITKAAQTLGIKSVLDRLGTIAQEIRDEIDRRSAESPEVEAMKKAREAIYPEYRALIDLINGYAITSEDTTEFQTFIRTLNNNIDYTRKHAIHHEASSDDKGGDDDGGDEKPDEETKE